LSSQQGFNRVSGTAAPFNPAQPLSYNDEQLAHWQDTLALILANRTPRDMEAITALGDILIDNDFNEAAQIWYAIHRPWFFWYMDSRQTLTFFSSSVTLFLHNHPSMLASTRPTLNSR
jgi:hypothetical protein